VAAVGLTLALGACGSKSSSATTSSPAGSGSTAGTPVSNGKSGGTVTALFGTAPDYLDPGEAYTTQGAEPHWLTYTGLYTYAHANGTAGTKLIPGLADALPKISSDGKTYEITLRKGLVYSDGTPVKAKDFGYTIQRSIRLNWGGKSFFTGNIAGADAFNSKKARTISGIKADDATGKITITLKQPYGAFVNVLAFPAAGLVPTGTKIANLSNTPPPGVGPYMIKDVVPNRSYSAVPNPQWAKMNIPGIPAAKVTVNAKIVSNTQLEAEQVINNSADVFDNFDTLPPALLAQAKQQAADRFSQVPAVSTYYFFMNTTTKPFNNQMARQAVDMAIDRRAISRLSSGTLTPGCFFLPPGMQGHPEGNCPAAGDPNAKPDLAAARALLKKSGEFGAKVTVWGQNRSPRKEYIDYYTSVLNDLGFKATTKLIADAAYFPTIGNLKSNPQTGFADWNQDFPHPSDFYLLLDEDSIQDTNNQNFSQVKDPHIQSELKELNAVPATDLATVSARWAALDKYVEDKAYFANYGYLVIPKFMSDRIDYKAAIVSPVYGNDWTSWSVGG
jgi:peptide/nickel transport system substrate-binding protein